MGSIYQQALGEQFSRLHPRIQQRFGFDSRDQAASVGRGVMEQIWYAKWAACPLLIGTMRHIMFPQGGRRIPFTIENYAYRDSFGRETVSWNRTFRFAKQIRRFDATMIYSKERERLVDYLGCKQHLAVDLSVSVQPNGGIRIRSGEQRFYERWLQFRFPAACTGTADVTEWYDDEEQQYKISVEVTNPLFGPVFRYSGSFQSEFISHASSVLPLDVKPLREERRE